MEENKQHKTALPETEPIPSAQAPEALLDIRGLRVEYHTDEDVVYAVNGLDLTIGKGESLGLVGETGAGKTTTALGIMRLLPEETGKVEAGSITFDGVDLLSLSHEEMRRKRGEELSMIFQDPMTALNPVLTVGDQISEVLRSHHPVSLHEAMEKAGDMLELVGIPRARLNEYPHQFSGGMKQRVIIAIALACRPKLLIADEPTTALDVTIQAQILDLMKKLQKEDGSSILLITHDLGVVAEMCTRVIVMYAGKIVEMAPVEKLFATPSHPYTQGLIASVPKLGSGVKVLPSIPGSVPDLASMPTGCRFAPRCKYATDKCREQEPELLDISEDQKCRCWRTQEG